MYMNIAQLRHRHQLSWAWVALVLPGVTVTVTVTVTVNRKLSHSLAKPPSNLQSWNLAHVLALGGRWKSHLIFFLYSCQQMITAVDNWWQLVWNKFNWYFYVYTKVDTCAEFLLSTLIFTFISCQQLSSAVDGCGQLTTAEMKKNWLEFLCTH